MAAYNNPYLFGKIILVSPQSVKTAMINPKKHSNISRTILNMPVIGSLIYNICMNRHAVNEHFSKDLFAYPNTVPKEFNKGYHETAHLGNAAAKYLYTSTQCHYTTASISRAISQLDNCIYIISGKKETDIKNTVSEYTSLNPAIETFLITNAKHLPQIEQPGEFVQTVNICLS
jgi:ABC-type branched-subunit amino acid transport system substrate-binding protein